MNVFITNVVVCNSAKDPLPHIENTLPPVYVSRFSPAPLGNTGKLYFKVSFTTTPGIRGGDSFYIKATVQDPDLYNFTEDENVYGTLQFLVNKSESPVYLEFRLKNLEPLSNITPARLKISAVTENSSQKTTYIKGNN